MRVVIPGKVYKFYSKIGLIHNLKMNIRLFTDLLAIASPETLQIQFSLLLMKR